MLEPFARVGSLRKHVPGVGLGLATAGKIISAHRGCIEVRSAPGRGSRFEIRLPSATADRTGTIGRDRVACRSLDDA